MSKSWAERHPIITGALVGSVVPGIGTLFGALAGVVYDITLNKDDAPEPDKLLADDNPDPPSSTPESE